MKERDSRDHITGTLNEGTVVQFAAVALIAYQEAKVKGLEKEIPLDSFLLQEVTE